MPHKICPLVNVEALKAIKAANKKDGIIPFVLTTLEVDRDSEVVMPNGAKLDNYMKNPVFVWVHDIRNKPPIGKILIDTIVISEQELKADVKFDLNDPFAKLIYEKYLGGFLNAGSMRFIPLEIGDPILAGQKGATIKVWELLEFSAVPVPANQSALAQVAKSINDLEEETKAAETFIEEVKKFLNPEAWLKEIKELEDATNFKPSTYIKEIEYKSDVEGDEIEKSFAIINKYKKEIPEDATIMECPEMNEVPHPYAGKEIVMKEIVFVPPLQTEKGLEYWDSSWSDTQKTDDEIIKGYFGDSEIKVSAELLSLTKDAKSFSEFGKGFDGFLIQGSFGDDVIKSVTDFLKNKPDKNENKKTFKEAASEMIKLLENDKDYLAEIKKEKYLDLKEVYDLNSKDCPEYRDASEETAEDHKNPVNMSQKEKELLLKLATEVARKMTN